MTTQRYRSEASLALAEHKERIVRELLDALEANVRD